jgi:hypothetical protein
VYDWKNNADFQFLRTEISPIWRFGDTSDEITGIQIIYEYSSRPVDICNFRQPLSLALRSIASSRHPAFL